MISGKGPQHTLALIKSDWFEDATGAKCVSLSVGYIILLYLALHLLSPALLYLLFNMTYTSMLIVSLIDRTGGSERLKCVRVLSFFVVLVCSFVPELHCSA